MELTEDSECLHPRIGTDGNGLVVLSEEKLRQLSRSFPGLLDHNEHPNDPPPAQVQQLRRDLLHTAQNGRLLPSHGTAAVNALCAFIAFCSKCPNKAWHALCFSPATCKSLFHILVDRSEGFKAKPARQLLVTLSNVLVNYPDKPVQRALIYFIVTRCVGLLLKKEDAKSVKCCIQALEFFLKKGIITAPTIIFASARDLTTGFPVEGEIKTKYDHPAFRKAVEGFITQLLQWVRYPDCAPAISHFLPRLIVSLNEVVGTEEQKENRLRDESKFPFWITPIKWFVKREIGNIDSLEKHVLPELLYLSAWDRKSFLATLPLDELRRGEAGRLNHADTKLCLLTLNLMNSSLKKSGMALFPHVLRMF